MSQISRTYEESILHGLNNNSPHAQSKQRYDDYEDHPLKKELSYLKNTKFQTLNQEGGASPD
jgi:hypothetical protein